MLRFIFVTFKRKLFKPPLYSYDNSKLLKVKKKVPIVCRKTTIFKTGVGNKVAHLSHDKSPFILPELILKWIKVGIMFITFLFYLTFFILLMIEVTQ